MAFDHRNMDEDFHRTLRREEILGKAHLADHKKLHQEVNKVEHQVKALKEHEHPYWEGKK